jgi:hypothetical protein
MGVKRLAAILLPALALIVLAAPAMAAPTWRLEQPAPPPGSPFAIPLGTPGDMQFLAPNHGLLAVEGNATVPQGLYFYDGVEWRQLATVCGGPGRTTRIAIASAREFWTISVPSRPRAQTGGTALCRFLDGNVVGSFSTPLESADPFREMTAAACLAPDDCWFGGIGAVDGSGERRGAFHLHWNGAHLETIYAPQGRGVTDLEPHRGTLWETVRVGKTPLEPNPDLVEPEPVPKLIHRITPSGFLNDAFTPASSYLLPPTFPFLPPTSVPIPMGGSELLALDSDGQQVWAVGGGATSGPAAPEGGLVQRPPLSARIEGTSWKEVVQPYNQRPFGLRDRFVDVAAVPGTSAAWVAVENFDDRSTTAHAKVALLEADGSSELVNLPNSGPGRGSAAKIAFTAPNEGWMATSAGWLFHYTDGTAWPRNADPAYLSTITFRPNEAAEQFLPDTPPVDDSALFAPPPVELEQGPPAQTVRRLPALVRRVRTKLRGRTLVVRFLLARQARVQIIARRKGRTVARTRARMLQPGSHVLRLRLHPKRWPQRLSFRVREPGQDNTGAPDSVDTVPTGGGGDTITTGGDTVATRAGR